MVFFQMRRTRANGIKFMTIFKYDHGPSSFKTKVVKHLLSMSFLPHRVRKELLESSSHTLLGSVPSLLRFNSRSGSCRFCPLFRYTSCLSSRVLRTSSHSFSLLLDLLGISPPPRSTNCVSSFEVSILKVSSSEFRRSSLALFFSKVQCLALMGSSNRIFSLLAMPRFTALAPSRDDSLNPSRIVTEKFAPIDRSIEPTRRSSSFHPVKNLLLPSVGLLWAFKRLPDLDNIWFANLLTQSFDLFAGSKVALPKVIGVSGFLGFTSVIPKIMLRPANEVSVGDASGRHPLFMITHQKL